jgi:hypothetical protein
MFQTAGLIRILADARLADLRRPARPERPLAR